MSKDLVIPDAPRGVPPIHPQLAGMVMDQPIGEGLRRERTGNDLCTPPWLWRTLAKHLGPIALDPCSNDWSTVEAEGRFYGPADGGLDGLAEDWHAHAVENLVFVNPPYGRGHLKPWTAKMIAEAEKGCEIVALVPCSPDTSWWQSCIPSVRAIAYLLARVSFDGGAHGSGTFPSALLYWGPRPHLFLHAFAAFADGRFVR